MSAENRHKIFILETADPFEYLKDINEGVALESTCKNLGHWVKRIQLFNDDDLIKSFDYIASIDPSKGGNEPLVIHLSMHGNKDGIAVGPDFIKWDTLATYIKVIYNKLRYYKGKIILVLSSCGAKDQKVTKWLTDDLHSETEKYVPPEFIFTHNVDTISWKDALIGWTVLYRMALIMDYDNKETVMASLEKIAGLKIGDIKYHRWDNEASSYKTYSPKQTRT